MYPAIFGTVGNYGSGCDERLSVITLAPVVALIKMKSTEVLTLSTLWKSAVEHSYCKMLNFNSLIFLLSL